MTRRLTLTDLRHDAWTVVATAPAASPLRGFAWRYRMPQAELANWQASGLLETQVRTFLAGGAEVRARLTEQVAERPKLRRLRLGRRAA